YNGLGPTQAFGQHRKGGLEMKELVRLRMRPSRDKKSFRYMLDYRDQSGRRRQISLGHADKRKAERQRYEKQLELQMNVAEPISMRLTDFFQDSLIRTKGQVRATTLKERAKTMRDFTECVGDIDVQDVRYGHGERFIQYCLTQNLSAGTITKKVKQLKRTFQLAEDRGQLDRHPLRRLKPPKSPRRKIRVFTDHECHSLCMMARQYEEKGSLVKWELLIRMGLSTGMRRGELMNTTWRDIDFARMTVDVAPKKDTLDTWEWHIKDTERRTLPLTAELIKLLVEHQMSQSEGCPYVFVPMARYQRIQESRRAGKWDVEKGRSPISKFCYHFNKIRDLANIRTGTFHDLRRTCLSNWIVQGLSLHEVKELAGHASIETTERFYLAVRKDVLDRARAASEASRKGQSVARLLRAPSESDKDPITLSISNLQSKL
ncbi:MAG: tyrosine-type recombinase/integrase, partial [Planctomycetota bacterium]